MIKNRTHRMVFSRTKGMPWKETLKKMMKYQPEEFKDQLNGIFKCYTYYGNSSCDGKDNEFYNCWMAAYFENIFTILTKCTKRAKKTNLIKISLNL